MIIRLVDGFEFECESVIEEVSDYLSPAIRFENIELAKSGINAKIICEKFTIDNCKIIKVFKDKDSTIPTETYTDYCHLSFFNKTIKGDGKYATIACKTTGSQFSMIAGN